MKPEHYRVICVFLLTDQVELRSVETNRRYYFKNKARNALLKSLQPGDIVKFDGTTLRQVRNRKRPNDSLSAKAQQLSLSLG